MPSIPFSGPLQIVDPILRYLIWVYIVCSQEFLSKIKEKLVNKYTRHLLNWK